MAERRNRKRKFLMFYTRIFDRRTGELLGYLVDLTPEGAMVVCEKALPAGEVFRLRMELPEDMSDRKYLEFAARCMWCRPDVDPRYFDAGFQLIDVPAPDVALIDRMVELYGFRDN